MGEVSHLLQRMQDYLWPRGTGADIWAIVDGARDRYIYWFLLNSNSTHSCLYARPHIQNLSDSLKTQKLLEVAPYLIRLYPEDGLTRRLIEEGWGSSWGVFLKCDAGIDRLRRHLRSFLRVRDTSGKLMLFRYYDPRVLRTYLPTCTADELRTVFGPIECFWTETADPGTMLRFAVTGTKLRTDELRLQ